jgi:peptidoglycan/LPS O-acetylase OafA/YrhL
VLRYATEAAYPFYILHQTVIVAVAYIVCAWDWPVWAKFTLIAVASLALSVGIYEVAVRRWGPVRFLFGMKAKRRATGAPAGPTPAEPAPAARS